VSAARSRSCDVTPRHSWGSSDGLDGLIIPRSPVRSRAPPLNSVGSTTTCAAATSRLRRRCVGGSSTRRARPRRVRNRDCPPDRARVATPSPPRAPRRVHGRRRAACRLVSHTLAANSRGVAAFRWCRGYFGLDLAAVRATAAARQLGYPGRPPATLRPLRSVGPGTAGNSLQGRSCHGPSARCRRGKCTFQPSRQCSLATGKRQGRR
jgi:hypothetical protein